MSNVFLRLPAVVARLQLAQAQQRVGSMQSSAGTAGHQAAGAQARLRAGVRCLESLHSLLKGALEQAGSSGLVDKQVCGGADRRLSGRVDGQSREATCTEVSPQSWVLQ
jgi:hypothetical protein